MTSFWEQGPLGVAATETGLHLSSAAAFPSLLSLVPSTDWLPHRVLLGH